MKLRRATTADIVDIVALGRAMHPVSTFADMAFDGGMVAETAETLINSDAGFAQLVEEQGRVCGGMLGMTYQSFFGPDRIAGDIALFLLPGARGREAGAALVESFAAWAAVNGARRVTIGNSAGMDDTRFVQLGEHAGFQRAGSILYRTISRSEREE